MNDNPISPRLASMRDALIGEVDSLGAGEKPRRRLRKPSRGAAAAVAGAFLLGSALTGGLTAAAFAGPDADALIETSLATSTRYQVEVSNYGALLGTPAFEVAQGQSTLSLGTRPAGADRVAYTWQCLDSGTITVTVNGTTASDPVSCTPSSGEQTDSTGSQWNMRPVTSGKASIEVSSEGSARYAVWASWAKAASIATPSAQQQDETADGVVTLTEYTAAFNRLEACSAQAGHPMSNVPLSWFSDGVWTGEPGGTGPWYLYSTPSDGLETFDTQCYPREFQDVDDLWQTEHPMPADPPAQPTSK